MMRNADRNRDMFNAFQAGRTIDQLCADHGLTEKRVRTVLTDERHRRALSPEPFYRELRKLSGFKVAMHQPA